MRTRSRSRRRDLHSIVVALVAAAIATGCAVVAPTQSAAPVPWSSAPATAAGTATSPGQGRETPPQVSATPARSVGLGGRRHDLLLLAGRPGAMGLERIDDAGTQRPISLPDPNVAWLSTSLDGRALLTTRDGRLFLSGLVAGDAPVRWQPVSTGGVDLGRLAGPLAFGALSPDGGRAAFIAADFTSGGPFDVVVLPVPNAARRDANGPVGPPSGLPSVTRVERPPEGAPPNWIGRKVVVLARTSADAVGTVIVDAAGGLTDGPSARGDSSDQSGSLGGLSISADGERLAVMAETDGRIDIRSVARWLAGAASGTATVGLEPEPDGSRSVAWLAMASDGQTLALVRTTDDGTSEAVTIHDEATAWRQVRRIALPAGAERAVVSWLP